ncbi:MAG TPA: hypothetical protein PL110_16350 [Candidatus Eremiobacteraeota bacterium]|nr:hypothetical protein [Candidatus Eremiobacteraeota bacterium]
MKLKHHNSSKISITSLFLILLLCIFTPLIEARSDFIKLSGYFIDPSSHPLVIYNSTFPKAIIYQNNNMYAPATDYVNMLGLTANFQNLPSKFTLNGQDAPLSLLATGPDRSRGQEIYYLNVTDTLNFLGIKYNTSTQNNQPRVTVTGTVAQDTSSSSGSISGKVTIYKPFDEGSITLTEDYINTARIPTKRAVATTPLPQDGTFNFTGLQKGDYTITATIYRKIQGDLLYDVTNKKYYYTVQNYTTTYSQRILLKNGENAGIVLDKGIESVTQQILYTDIVTPTPVYPNNPNNYWTK